MAGHRRLVYFYTFQDTTAGLDVYVDTDFAGCSNTRRSTSGGVALFGGCNVKHWSKTQALVAPLSGETELVLPLVRHKALAYRHWHAIWDLTSLLLAIPMPLQPLGSLGGVAWARSAINIAPTFGPRTEYNRNSLGWKRCRVPRTQPTFSQNMSTTIFRLLP